MSKFFITGLPRSRTAWFAAFMTQGDVFCWHEAMNGCKTRQEFYNRMELPYRQVGDSDCGLYLTDFQDRRPMAPTLIIHRAMPEPIPGMCEALRKLRGYHIEFEFVDERLAEIHRYLIGEYPDPRRVDLFCRMNIQLKEITGDPESLRIWQ